MFTGKREILNLVDGSVLSGADMTIAEHVVFEGSGNSDECANLLGLIIWPDSGSRECRSVGDRCPIGGVLPPQMEDLHFFGMVCAIVYAHFINSALIVCLKSAYYYALDCVRELGPDHIEHWYIHKIFTLNYVDYTGSVLIGPHPP